MTEAYYHIIIDRDDLPRFRDYLTENGRKIETTVTMSSIYEEILHLFVYLDKSELPYISLAFRSTITCIDGKG